MFIWFLKCLGSCGYLSLHSGPEVFGDLISDLLPFVFVKVNKYMRRAEEIKLYLKVSCQQCPGNKFSVHFVAKSTPGCGLLILQDENN